MLVLRQVVERLGLAAENTRLFEEAQRIAQREALVNEISARMQVTTNVEAVVAAATQSLADAFQAPRVAIRLGSPVAANGPRASKELAFHAAQFSVPVQLVSDPTAIRYRLAAFDRDACTRDAAASTMVPACIMLLRLPCYS